MFVGFLASRPVHKFTYRSFDEESELQVENTQIRRPDAKMQENGFEHMIVSSVVFLLYLFKSVHRLTQTVDGKTNTPQEVFWP